MSSRPDADKVRELRKTALRYYELNREITELDERMKSDIARLKKIQDEYQSARLGITDALENMDCTARGNAGWEYRIAWMLAEFAAQTQTRTS